MKLLVFERPKSLFRNPYFFAGISVLLWSTAATAFTIALKYLSIPLIINIASLTSASIMFVFILAEGRLGELKEQKPQELFNSLFMSTVNPLLYYILLFKAYKLIPAQEAQPLSYTWPIMLTILSVIFLKERLSLRKWIGIALSFLGVMFISTKGHLLEFKLSDPRGVALALLCAFVWASYWLLNVRDKREEVVKNFLNFFFIGTALTIFHIFTPGDLGLTTKGISAAVYIGICEMGIAFLAWGKAMSLSKSKASLAKIIYLIPFLSLMVLSIVLGESILPSTIIGLLFIITGIFI